MPSAIASQVIEHLEALPLRLQQQVLQLVRTLDETLKRGTSGTQLVRFAKTIHKDELQLMSKVIEQGCEQVDLDEW